MKIAFFGTPDFAVATLQALQNSDHQVLFVATQPDRPRGRGMKVTPSPVKKLALEYELPILQPERLPDPAVTDTMQKDEARCSGCCRLWLKDSSGASVWTKVWCHQLARVASAQISRGRPHATGHYERGPGGWCYHHEDGRGLGHRGHPQKGGNSLGTAG